jgi:hypothetical protein
MFVVAVRAMPTVPVVWRTVIGVRIVVNVRVAMVAVRIVIQVSRRPVVAGRKSKTDALRP